MQLLILVLLCSSAVSHGIVREAWVTFWSDQFREFEVLETTTEISITECAVQCMLSSTCKNALFDEFTLQCELTENIIFFAPGNFEPDNTTLSTHQVIYFTLKNS